MVIEESVLFMSDDLMLEGALSYDQDIPRGPGVILCSPHPHLGGNMENNIITALYHFFAAKGFISLRFNYRGVGNSQTSDVPEKEDLRTFWEDSWTPEDDLKIQDVISALNFLKGIKGVIDDCIFLVGYSFGAYLALRAVERWSGVKGLIVIAPTVHFHDFTYLNHCSLPKYVITSDNDFSYSLDELKKAYTGFCQPKELEIFKGGDHFFIGCEKKVASKAAQFILNHSRQ